jgi:Uma2 family endonuclease
LSPFFARRNPVPRPSTIRYTWADYLSTPEDTSRRYEVVDGELFVTAAPRFRHQEIAANLVRILGGLAGDHALGKVVPGPITVHLHDELVVEPDLIFIRSDRLTIVDPEGGVEGPPDLVVEILSPSNQSYDRNLKRKHYLENGIPELWILDADDRTIEVWKSGDKAPTMVRDMLEWHASGHRFAISLDDVFRS